MIILSKITMNKTQQILLENPADLHINIRKNGLEINGIFMEQVIPEKIVEMLGQPRVSKFSGKHNKEKFYRELWIYDTLGFHIEMPTTAEAFPYLDFRLDDEEERRYRGKLPFFDFNPKALFSGKITINKKELIASFTDKQLEDAYIFFEKKVGFWELNFQIKETISKRLECDKYTDEELKKRIEILRSEPQPFESFYFTYHPPKPKRVSSGKYTLRPATESDLRFSSLNFKLAIVEELMYVQKLLTPEFDVYDFCKDYDKREIDPEKYYDKAIPEVKKWFENLPIPTELAYKVTELCLDGGNNIYGQMIPFWDGEDDYYDIKKVTEDDLKQFPNLKKITGTANFFSPKAQKLMESKGIVFDF